MPIPRISSLLILGHGRLAVRFRAQVLISLVIDVLLQEMDAAVAEQELGAARMSRLESDLRRPIERAMTKVGRFVVAGVEVDWNQRRTVAVAIVGDRSAGSGVLGTRGANLADEDRVRQSVGDVL